MIPYYCNDAVLQLPELHSLVDLSKHCLELVTAEGAELRLEIDRARTPANTTLQSYVESSLAERRRSQRGFELLSLTSREYPEVVGTEARLTHVDKDRGPLFRHEFHCALQHMIIGYVGICRLGHAAACDQFMQTMLQNLRFQ